MEISSNKRVRSCDHPANGLLGTAEAMEFCSALDSTLNTSNLDSPVIAVCTDQNLIKFIFQRLELSDLCAAASVCRLWNEVSNSEDFWSEVSFKDKTILPNQVAAVLYRHRCVQKLDLSGLKIGLSDSTLFRRIVPYLEQLKELSYVHAQGCEASVDSKVVSTISECLPSLKALKFHGVSLTGLSSACTLSHSGLETLSLTGCKAFDVTLRCRSLRSLSLANGAMPRLLDVSNCPALVELDVKGCRKMHDASIRGALTGLTNLKALQLGKGLAVTDETIREMGTVLTCLTQLVLADTPGLTLNQVRGFPSLRVLDISRCETFTPSLMQPALESFAALEVLLMDNCNTLAQLKLNMPHLREISLRGCSGLSDLELNCWRLAVLNLGPVTNGAPGNNTLQRLAVSSGALKKMEWVQCRKLSQLELNCPYLTDLVIRDCDNITPAALEALGDKGPPPKAAAALLPASLASGSGIGSRGMNYASSSGAGSGLGRVEMSAMGAGTDADADDLVAQRFAAALWHQDDAAAEQDAADGADAEGDLSPRFEAAAAFDGTDDDHDSFEHGSGSDSDDDEIGPPPGGAAAAAAAEAPAGGTAGEFASWAWLGSAAAAPAAGSSEPVAGRRASRDPTCAAAAAGSPGPSCVQRPNTRSSRAAVAAASSSPVAAAAGSDVSGAGAPNRPTNSARGEAGSSAAAAAPGCPSIVSEQAGTSNALNLGDDSLWDDAFQQGPTHLQQQSSASAAAAGQRSEPAGAGPLLADADSDPDYLFGEDPHERAIMARMTRRRRTVRSQQPLAGATQQQQQQQAACSQERRAGSRGNTGARVSGWLSRLNALGMQSWRGVADAPAAAAETAAAGPAGIITRGSHLSRASVAQARASRAVGAQRGQSSTSQAGGGPASLAPASAAPAAAVNIPMVVHLTGDGSPGAAAAGARGGGGSGPTPPVPPPQRASGGRGGLPKLRSLRVEGCDGLRRLSLKHSGLQVLSISGCRTLSSLVLEAPELGRLELDEVADLQGISLHKVGLTSLALGGCSGLSGLELSSGAVNKLDLRGCGQLRQLLLDCPALTVVDATFCSELGDAGLASAVTKAPPLTQLVLSVCYQVSSTGLLSLSNLPTLQELDLSYTEVSSLDSVFASCPQLKTLNLSSCRSLKRDALAPLLSADSPALPELASLDASYCDLDASTLARLLSSCGRLQHLALNGCSSVTDLLWQQLEQGHLQKLQQPSAAVAAGSGVAVSSSLDMDDVAADAADMEVVDCVSSCSSSLESLSLVKCSNLKSLCLGLLPASGEVEVLQPKHYLLSGDRKALHARSATYSWVEVPSTVANITSLRLGLSGVQVVALALPKLAHLDLSSCGYLRVLELRCPLLLTLQLQACKSLPMYNMAQAVVSCSQLEKLDVQHMLPAKSGKKSGNAAADSGNGSADSSVGSVLATAVAAAPGVLSEGGAARFHQLLDDITTGHPCLQRVLRCPVNCAVCARAAGLSGYA